jgi:hypothetical protein
MSTLASAVEGSEACSSAGIEPLQVWHAGLSCRAVDLEYACMRTSAKTGDRLYAAGAVQDCDNT